MRKIWISRISSALEARGHKYSQFIGKLKKSGIKLNRKMLSEIAFHQPKIFDEIVEMVFSS
jgi:large subunit ribosomal protein L20